MKYKKWYRLDNAAKFYAAVKNTSTPRVFRYSAVLTEEIDRQVLQRALEQTVEVFKNFNVNLKKGLFWYYLEESNQIEEVKEEHLPVCHKLYQSSEHLLYRVTYYRRKISLEVSHILSDGRGSVEFFKLLLANYIKLRYSLSLDVAKENKSAQEKSENSFDKYYQKNGKTKKEKKKKQPVYRYKGRKYHQQTRFLECHMNVKEVLALAHQYQTTLTGLLIAVLIQSFQDELKSSDMEKYIKIEIPVDLRSYFKSYSSMNYFGMTAVAYQFRSREDTLEEILSKVNTQLKENLEKEKILERVNKMMALEKNWFCKIAPVVIKDLVLRSANEMTLQKSTTSLSNIGVIQLDPQLCEYVESASVLTSTDNFQFTICTIKEDLCIGISTRYVENEVIKNFCRFFSLQHKIPMKIDMSGVE